MVYQYKQNTSTAGSARKSQSHTNKMQEASVNLISFVIKQKIVDVEKNVFQRIQLFGKTKHKHGLILLSKTRKVMQQKQVEYQKELLSRLLNCSIQFVKRQNQKIQNIKLVSRQKSVQIMAIYCTRAEHVHTMQVFKLLKSQAQLKFTMNAYKMQKLTNWCSSLQKSLLLSAIQSLRVNVFNSVSKIKRFYSLQKFLCNKQAEVKFESFCKLADFQGKKQSMQQSRVSTNSTKLKNSALNQKQPRNQSEQFQQVESAVQNIDKGLEQEKNNLQNQLSELKRKNQQHKLRPSAEVDKLSEELQSLRFNADALEQDNNEIIQTIDSREQGNMQNSAKPTAQLSQCKIWKQIFNRLVKFVFENKDLIKSFNKHQILDNILTPLNESQSNLDQLKQENIVLKDLLSAYKENFPEPNTQPQELNECKSLSELIRQKRNLYLVVEKLSSWGLDGSEDIQNIKADLANLKASCENERIKTE